MAEGIESHNLKIHQNRLAVFMNSLGHVFEMVDFLKEQFLVEQQPPIET